MISLLKLLALIFQNPYLFIAYVKGNAFPQPLSPEDEKYYLQKWQEGDLDARNKLIEHNLRLVAHIAKKYEQNKEDQEDLISIGTIGLIKGVESFSLDKGTKLATYVARCIDNEILMFLRSSKKSNKDVSLQDPIGHDKEGNEISLIDVLKSDSPDLTEKIQTAIEIEQIFQYIHLLDDREREVIAKRYGLGNQEEYTQREIAKSLSISRSYVSRIEKRALMKMFHAFYREEERKKKNNQPK
ncbi:RNA polymerase sporulation sigma factor SigK [Alkalibacillus haloalkaliphilus]|uniref:RNA polymerase sporulation sigma factor SigK n=1 Tax=Alkalibacillus haloalkaliphilus TaxID=94136 RepID=UPI002935F073|nr:RNA polymerase sporulation sigma factor SigK [Alkalibacillus haloalkaliphilus]MDV2581067.1 RNA polymerase sporulation sigma factor SigK [Alkalibacillus haloalkaliphilus]